MAEETRLTGKAVKSLSIGDSNVKIVFVDGSEISISACVEYYDTAYGGAETVKMKTSVKLNEE